MTIKCFVVLDNKELDFFEYILAETAEENLYDSVLFGGALDYCDKCQRPIRWHERLGWCDAETGEESGCGGGYHHVERFEGIAETAEENLYDSVLFGGDGSEQVENEF